MGDLISLLPQHYYVAGTKWGRPFCDRRGGGRFRFIPGNETRLAAGNSKIRGDYRCVCFTEEPREAVPFPGGRWMDDLLDAHRYQQERRFQAYSTNFEIEIAEQLREHFV